MNINTKIKKFVAQTALCLTIISLVLMCAAPLTSAAAENYNNQILIAATPAGTPPQSASPAGTATGGTEASPGGATTVPATPPAGREFGPDDPLIPLGTKGYEQLPQLDTGGGIVSMFNQFVGGLFQNIKYILGAVAVFFIVLAAVKLIVAGDNEEVVGNQKRALTYAIIGLAVIGFSSEMAKVFSVVCPAGQPDCIQGGFLSRPSAMLHSAGIFTLEVKIFITFIKYLIGGIAVLMLVRNGIRFIALQGKEESVTLDKKNVAFTSLGLILIIIASTVIDKVLYIVDTTRYPVGGVQPGISPQQGIQELVGITNVIVSIVAPVAIIVMIAGAIMYATAGGKDEQTTKAKRMITLGIIGMILIFGAFAIVSTIVSGQFSP